jgi:hypothetical protein
MTNCGSKLRRMAKRAGLLAVLALGAAGALLDPHPRPLGLRMPLAQAQSDQDNPIPPSIGGSQVQVLPPQTQRLPPPSRARKPAPGNALQIPSINQPSAPGPSIIDEALSSQTSSYLHHHRLPFVQAQVLKDAGGALSTVVLSGQVATEFGKQDAAKKARDYLRDATVEVRNQLQVNPALQTGQMASNSVHVLPQAFYGCWRGTSLPSDSSQYLGGCPPGYEVPETQELCFRKVGEGGFEITSQSASSSLPNFRDRTELVSSQGDSRVDLRDIGTYDMPGLFTFSRVGFNGASRCDLSGDKETLACEGTTVFRCNGLPWYRTTGRTVMRRLSR